MHFVFLGQAMDELLLEDNIDVVKSDCKMVQKNELLAGT